MEKIKGPSMQSHRLYVNTFAEADIELKVYDSSPLNDYAKEKNDEARMDIAPLF